MPNIVDTSLDFTTRYYLLESVDAILDAFGENCIVSGCEVNNIVFDNTTKVLSLDISPGLIICDKKLIKFPTTNSLEFNLVNYNQIGKLAVLVSYRYLRTSRPNLAILTVKYIDADNYCDEWWEELDKLIISIIEYDTIDNTFIKYESNFFEEKSLVINNSNRIVRKLNNMSINIRTFFQQLIPFLDNR